MDKIRIAECHCADVALWSDNEKVPGGAPHHAGPQSSCEWVLLMCLLWHHSVLSHTWFLTSGLLLVPWMCEVIHIAIVWRFDRVERTVFSSWMNDITEIRSTLSTVYGCLLLIVDHQAVDVLLGVYSFSTLFNRLWMSPFHSRAPGCGCLDECWQFNPKHTLVLSAKTSCGSWLSNWLDVLRIS